MQCLIKGCCFLFQHIPYEVFEFHKNFEQQYVFQHLERSSIFPFLLVNIGSGVSVIKVRLEVTLHIATPRDMALLSVARVFFLSVFGESISMKKKHQGRILGGGPKAPTPLHC